MRQILYKSKSRVGLDRDELEKLTIAAGVNNALADITGLLWTDGNEFVQVLEGDSGQLEQLLQVLYRDPRHTDVQIVDDRPISTREYGDWSMQRPVADTSTHGFEHRMLLRLDAANTAMARAVQSVIRGSKAYEARI